MIAPTVPHSTATHGSFCRGTIIALLLLAALIPARSATEGPVLKIEVGLARSCFSDVNLNDAQAAYRVFIRRIGLGRGYQLDPEVTFYDDTRQFETAINRGTIHFLVMDAEQYLDLEQNQAIRPFFVPTFNAQEGRRYLVLVHRDSGIKSVADLRGRPVLLLQMIANNVCRSWLETLLPDDPTNPPENFVASLETVAKPTAAVLPVFFKQKAACVVDEDTFNLMKELNPQVGNMLEPIAISGLIVDYIICLGEGNWISPEAKADTVKSLSDLSADPAGRQILAMFRISNLVAFQQDQLSTVRALRHSRKLSAEAAAANRGGQP